MQPIKEFDLKQVENQVRNHYESMDIPSVISSSPRKQKIVFIEGPPTMNGEPHAGHLRGRIIKDFWYRFKTLCGYNVVFNAGWDTQGLPVELQAEKELGIKGGKKEITESVGIDRLVDECKKIVLKYNKKWLEVDRLLGISLDPRGAYWTYKDNYIEREWRILKKAHQNGILSEGYRVVAYCPGCQTSLSHAEVNQGYETVQDPSLYYKVQLEDQKYTYLIVWTTMPFTVVTDTMVGLKPDEEYAYVQVNQETWIVAKKRVDDFFSELKITDYKIVGTITGKELDGKRYIHPILDLISGLKKEAESNSNFHTVVAEEFVDADTGSGIVHLSPANGEEDFDVAKKRNIPVFNPIDDEVKFTDDAGKYSGLFVRDADHTIVEDLRKAGALVKIAKIKHKYPLCWRTYHRLVWLARREFFYYLDRLNGMAVNAAQKVEYFYEQPKNRFVEIIREQHPWCISRERFWGCPLPIWECKNCSSKSFLFSRQEIISNASELPDGENFELHRPWIDRIIVPCPKCSFSMQRVPFVLDTWHNSGAAPYASLDDNDYEQYIPAPFLTEGIDQTRGWAYTLLIENVIMKNDSIPPYNSFLFQGHVLDKNGNKMSKSLGNVIDAEKLLWDYSSDIVRFYFVWKSSPIESLNFDVSEMMSRPYQIISTLYHTHIFLKQNSQYDNYDAKYDIRWAQDNDLLRSSERWVLSRLQGLTRSTTHKNENCRLHESAKDIEEFIINDLSQTYIPITRGELWTDKEEERDRRFAIYATLRFVLKKVDVLLHPLCPFVTEYLYQTVFSEHKNDSIHNTILLEQWPVFDQKLEDTELEDSFGLMKDVISTASSARMKAKLKRRWPIRTAIVCVRKGEKSKLEKVYELLKTQINAEHVAIQEFEDLQGLEFLHESILSSSSPAANQFLQSSPSSPSSALSYENPTLPIRPLVKLNRKAIGPKAKENTAKIIERFEDTDKSQVIATLVKKGSIDFEFESEVGKTSIEIQSSDVEASYETEEGFVSASRENTIVFVPTTRDYEMMSKGLVKDIARRLQALRKEKGYNPTEILNAAHILDLDEETYNMLKEKQDELAFLVRVKKVSFSGNLQEYKEDDIDGKKIRLAIK